MATESPSSEHEFDYIIVGSGAGGGPLAARLARLADLTGQKKRVLVIEAGSDHIADGGEAREVSLVPGFHGLSTEHEQLSWRFWVRHYENLPAGVAKDPKSHPNLQDPPPPPPPPEGIFYPRATGLGGCTVHNAMITVAGPDGDWEDLADFVRDDSWRAGPMRAYFQRLERNEYHKLPQPVPTGWWGRFRDLLKWVIGRTPDHTGGRHGFDGWLHTSVTDFKLGLGDRQLIKMLRGALRQARAEGMERTWTLVRRFLNGWVLSSLDPNHSRTQAESPEGIVMVPLSVCGPRTTIHQNSAAPFVTRGRRSSPREFLIETARSHGEYLTIWTDVFVTRVLFEEGKDKPRAIGVSFLKGKRLYSAHFPPGHNVGEDGRVFVRQGGEVILCGGAFNTPQLLMLSGLGDTVHLKAVAGDSVSACVLTGRDGAPLLDDSHAPRRIHLPGIGRNLQDRYEVTVISEMKKDFSILDGATFKLPGTGNPDRHLKEWRLEGTGLYTSNGSVLGVLKRSNRDLEQPDLFIFGIPLPFYGYDVGYSKVGHIHDKFTWAILKGRTRNGDGVVRLRSTDPLATPDINFHYFNENTVKGKNADDPDLLALVDGVRFVRGIARRANGWFWGPVKKEVHPGTLAPPDDEAKIKAWIRSEAWGHHACGTCRMGPEGDPDAVLDSRFRVRRVDGLRVVDASIFPRIPGYFIVTNIYMASEKAADVILEDAAHGGPDSSTYPRELRSREVAAVLTRRKANDRAPPQPKPEDVSEWPEDVTGLALSGGGIRSATFNLGIMQAMARQRWLRRIDLLSTVSGGGYIGTFLGRWFDRLRPRSDWGGTDRQPEQSVTDHVEHELNDAASPAVAWLRRNGNYLAPQGAGDRQVDAAVFVRGIASVHFVVGVLLLAVLGAANAIRYGLLETGSGVLQYLNINAAELPIGKLLTRVLGVFYSPWFLLFEAVVLFMVVPRIVAYWLASQKRHDRYEPVTLVAVLVFSGTLLFAGVWHGLDVPLTLLGLAPLIAVVHIEMAWRRGHDREEAIGRGTVETQRLRVRNFLTYDLGLALSLAGGAFAFAVIDTIGHGLEEYLAGKGQYVLGFASFAAVLGALVPIARFAANLFAGEKNSQGPAAELPRPSREQFTAGALAVVLLTVPLIFVSFVSHVTFRGGAAVWQGVAVTLFAFVLSLIFAHRSALTFVNRSSLAQTYAARLTRAYLGATNPVRFRPQASNVTEVVAGDDVPSIMDYKPFAAGGPLHLFNMTVNQTVEFTSQRGNRDRKGENLAVSSIGMTIGKSWHARWGEASAGPAEGRKHPLPLEPIGDVRGKPHPLVDETGAPTRYAEMLSLGQWMGISGAAIGPGRGQTTKLGTALLYGLANLRTGYWWDSGLPQFARDGLPARTLLRRLLYSLTFVFQGQTLLLSEWVARFMGPWDRFWQLSDGGFFEVLGVYELIRRRVPRIIVCDGSADPRYEMEAIANLTRKARIDFGAEIEPFSATDYAAAGIPPLVMDTLGTIDDLKPEINKDGEATGPAKKHGALFWVRYSGASTRRSVLLYLRANLTGDEGVDIEHYRETHSAFPNEPTSDQFFDEEQWESYRRLGDHMMSKLTGGSPWFWNIPL